MKLQRDFLVGTLLGALVVSIAFVADAAFAGSGTGSAVNLGQRNEVNRTTVLTGSWVSRLLQITQLGEGPALRLDVGPGVPPLRVNSSSWVRHLNADYLDGMNSTRFVQGSGRVTTRRTAAMLGAASADILGVPGFGSVTASCGATPGYDLAWSNDRSGVPVRVWTADGTNPVGFASVAVGSAAPVATGAAADDRIVRLEVATDKGELAGVTVAVHAGAGGCVFAARAESGTPVSVPGIPRHSQDCPFRLSRTGKRCSH